MRNLKIKDIDSIAGDIQRFHQVTNGTLKEEFEVPQLRQVCAALEKVGNSAIQTSTFQLSYIGVLF